jgi:hypothetical protein
LTAVVEVDVAVVVEPIVDLDVDLRLRSSGTVDCVARGQGARSTMGSTSNVAVNVKVLVNVIVEDNVEGRSPP